MNQDQVTLLKSKLIGAEHRHQKAARAYAENPSVLPDLVAAKEELLSIKTQIEALAMVSSEIDQAAIRAYDQDIDLARQEAVAKIETLLKERTRRFSSLCKQISSMGESYQEFVAIPARVSDCMKYFSVEERAEIQDRLTPLVVTDGMIADKLYCAGLFRVLEQAPAFCEPKEASTYTDQINKSAGLALEALKEQVKEK